MLGKTMRSRFTPYLFLLPAMTLFVTFIVIPVLKTIQYSFTNYDGFSPALTYVGLSNYKNIITDDPAFWQAAKNNLKAVLVMYVIGVGISLILALIFNKIVGKNAYRMVFFLPIIISTVAAGYMWSFIYEPTSGVLSEILKILGLPVVDLLGNPKTAFNSVLMVDIWKNQGYNMVLFLAGLQTIPEEMYESCAIDGASPWKRFWRVTFPLLRSTTVMVVLLTLIGTLKTFDLVFVMTNGGPGYSTEVMTTRVFTEAFGRGGTNFFGYASADAVIMFVMIMIMIASFIFMSATKKNDIEY